MGTQLRLFEFEPILNVLAPAQAVAANSYEYLLLITLPSQVKEQVKELRTKLDHQIGITKENLISVPQISLIHLKEKSSCDDYIVERTKAAISGIYDFDIQINGARTADHTYTRDLLLNVESSELPVIYQALSKSFKLRSSGKFVPSISVARGITKNKFEKIENTFHEFDLREAFICNTITILKREITMSGNQPKNSFYIKIAEIALDNGIRKTA
jgi:hypothetical protein